MIKIKSLFWILLCITFLGCGKQNKKDPLIGHWHAFPSESSPFKTLDILDTLTITDQYILESPYVLFYKRVNRLGKAVLPSEEYSSSERFQLNNDTLTIYDSLERYNYVKSKLTNCILTDRYSEVIIDIRIDKTESGEPFEDSFKKFYSENLYVGRLKTGTPYKDSLMRVFPDSIFIQGFDVLIQIKHIKRLSEELIMKCDETDQPNINIHLGLNVPKEFFDRLRKEIPESIKIHRIVKTKTGDIGLAEF
ncbi:MAG: hypothetical protein JNM78_16855 [Cyclobacteriaceae bacterium]|nr:hypothetical protein [Cyclobacteriaceae bacterium]